VEFAQLAVAMAQICLHNITIYDMIILTQYGRLASRPERGW